MVLGALGKNNYLETGFKKTNKTNSWKKTWPKKRSITPQKRNSKSKGIPRRKKHFVKQKNTHTPITNKQIPRKKTHTHNKEILLTCCDSLLVTSRPASSQVPISGPSPQSSPRSWLCPPGFQIPSSCYFFSWRFSSFLGFMFYLVGFSKVFYVFSSRFSWVFQGFLGFARLFPRLSISF